MPLIEIKQLSKRFPLANGNLQALCDVNMAIDAGEILSIVGMSGAGKSTLLRCLIGLEKPTHGKILFHGDDIVNYSPAELSAYRKKIGVVFQNYHLFPARSVAENIAYPMEIHGTTAEARNARIDELLKLVHLESKRDSYPARLSGGEKQRIAIARALANRPEILFCDEPTSALDPKSIDSLLELLKELNTTLGLTIIIITHQWEVVKALCTKVALLSKGSLVQQGTVAELLKASLDLNSLVASKDQPGDYQ
jgi:D-methionine transport system ATP-binding protein